MKLTEEQKTRAGHFDLLVRSDGWKELERLANMEITRSMGSQDNKAAQDLNINTVCEERGYRKGIRWVIQQANTIQEIG